MYEQTQTIRFWPLEESSQLLSRSHAGIAGCGQIDCSNNKIYNYKHTSDITLLKMANNTMNDSAYISFSYTFNLDEELPTQDQFNQQIRQDVLTSTDETESLASRLNKINTAALNDFVIGCDVTSQNEP